MSGLPMYDEETGKMLPAEARNDYFTEDNFPSQGVLGVGSQEHYNRLRAVYLGKPRGCTIDVPIVLQSRAVRQSALQPVYIYTSANFPTYEMLEKHETRELTRGRYNELRKHYLGQPVPRKDKMGGGYGDFYIDRGMSWPEAYIAHSLSYEGGGNILPPDDEECMARSPYRLITEDNFPSYETLLQRNIEGLTPAKYAEIKKRYVGSYAHKDTTEFVLDLVRYLEC